MKLLKFIIPAAAVAATIVVLAIFTAFASHERTQFVAVLKGYNEVPAVSTSGWGFARIVISKDEQAISYELRYHDMEGRVTMAHIHLGQAGTNGGIVVWLCGGPKQECPIAGVVKGVITANDVIGPEGQGISAGELDELIRAIRSGAAYVNVHSDKFPTGEIRGQIE